MSLIRIAKIISFSSEDKNHKAENLLKDETEDKKWISSKSEETSEYVLFELEKPSEIRQLDIRNELSAIIEVLVGNKDDEEDDYKELLSSHSFMTPSESKSLTNTNRLKVFTEEDHLSKEHVNTKWQRVKVVCSQPFNKDLQFGIRSINLYNKIVLTDESKDALKIKTGVFALRQDSLTVDENKLKDESNKSSSVFTKWKAASEENKKNEEETIATSSNKQNNDEKKSDNDTKTASKYSKNDLTVNDKDESSKPTTSDKNDNNKKASMFGNSKTKPTNNQILSGVIFALSGFQNPLRSEIRDKGMKLGAKYRPDWTDDCTHLVCAFANTPKANQVKKAGGIIVTKDWIFDCEKEKKMLNVTDYGLPSDDDSDSEDTSKPRRAAKTATKKLSKLSKKDEFDDSYDEEEAENSDDKDFIVNSSDEEEDDFKMESESEESFDSDDSEKAKKSKKKRKHKEKKNSKKPKAKKLKKLPKKKSSKKKESDSSSSSSSSNSNDSGSSSDSDDLEAFKKKREKELKLKAQKNAKKEQTDTKKVAPESKQDKDASKSMKPNDSKSSKTNKKGIKYDEETDEEAKHDEDKENGSKKPNDMKKSLSTASNKTEINSDNEMEVETNEKEQKNWALDSFFKEIDFYIMSDGIDAKKMQKLERIIIAFEGKVNKFLSDDVKFVITDKKWNDEFEESQKENTNLKFVSSEWLLTCSKKRKFVAYQTFEVNPN